MKNCLPILILIFILASCSTTKKNESQNDLNINFDNLFLFNLPTLDSDLKNSNATYNHEQKDNEEDKSDGSNETIYKYDLESKTIISENGTKLILNDYEYVKQIDNCRNIKYVLSKISDNKYYFHLFNEKGYQIKLITIDAFYELPSLEISDDEKFFFIDSGTSQIRNIDLFEYEESKFIGHFTCTGNIYFLNNYLYMTQCSLERVPGYCLNELDLYYSVVRYNLNSNVTEVLLPYNSLKRFKIKDFSNNTFIIEQEYVSTISGWKGWQASIKTKEIYLIIKEDNKYKIQR